MTFEANISQPRKFDLCQDTLDEFVAAVDAKGGPHLIESSPEWHGLSYRPTLPINQALDPFSEDYCNLQIALYREISGRELDQHKNEHHDFDLEKHVMQRNAFGGDPADLVLHYMRLSKMMMAAEPPAGCKVLDLGCGWGLTSEFLAQLGCEVTAVDINANFVKLVTERSKRLGLGILALHGGFDDVAVDDWYDMVVFYECLHHAVRPWKVIERYKPRLAPGGAIAFAGEPVQEFWWKHWGIRCDPLSIYCIRRFGWFESGWSKSFVTKMFNRAGFILDYIEDRDPRMQPVVIARLLTKMNTSLVGELLFNCCDGNWIPEGKYVISKGDSHLHLNFPIAVDKVRLRIMNFRPKGITLDIFDAAGTALKHCELMPGENLIDLDFAGNASYRLVSDVWSPSSELGSPNTREFSFPLAAVDFLATAVAA